jgi:transposase, IS5 family
MSLINISIWFTNFVNCLIYNSLEYFNSVFSKKIQIMRQRFEQQFKIGTLQISDTKISIKTRDTQPKVGLALLELFNTPEYNERLFIILEQKIIGQKKQTGRPGMDLWQIFVMAMFRMALNLSYDRLHTMANNDKMLRQLLGIETESGFDLVTIGYQNIKDNVGLLSDDFLREINNIIAEFGNKEVFKKKETEALCLKADSFVAKSNVHYPTDYNLLMDCARKCLESISYFSIKYPALFLGWRKNYNWYRELKIKMRILGQSIGARGKYRETKILTSARDYLQKAVLLDKKVKNSLEELKSICTTLADYKKFYELEKYSNYLSKHIDLTQRRLINKETIPHQEKMFSIFETYTEWITKGKQNPSFELGKRLTITTNQYGLIEDYQIMNKTVDSEVVIAIVDRILSKNKIKSISFDKGYYSKENKELLQLEIEMVVLPKKGKCNKKELEEESQADFKKLRNKHSAVESNINELTYRGLNKCPDKSEPHFDRYLALGVIAFNLHKIGNQILINLKAQEKKAKEKAKLLYAA